jgi:iron complex transport system substrate-binding protein
MMDLDRRTVLAGLASFATSPARAQARVVTDSGGRQVRLPERIARVFAAGPPASVLLAMLAPDMMTGWVRPPRAAEKPFLPPALRDLPETGRLTGRGDTVNLEVLVAARPDLILDFGSVTPTYASLADRVQHQTAIPYLLVDGRFAETAASLRLVGRVLGREERSASLAAYAEATFAEVDRVLARVPEGNRPRVYLARGPEGLETGTSGSINTEIIERVGGVNVAKGLREQGGLATVSPEQVLAWNPDVVITLDRSFFENARSKAGWSQLPAVASGRLHLAPSLPFGWIDSPPSLNRLIGLRWLIHVLYPRQAEGDLYELTRAFYRLFYQVELTDSDLVRLLDGALVR